MGYNGKNNYRVKCEMCGLPLDVPTWKYCDRVECRDWRTKISYDSYKKKYKKINRVPNT